MTAKSARRRAHRKIHQAARFIAEPLESRVLLSSTGLTVISHGYQLNGVAPIDPGWESDMAFEILGKKGGSPSNILDVKFQDGVPDSLSLAPNGETIVEYDWAKHSND